MTPFRELQQSLHLLRVSLLPKRGLEVVVRHVVANTKTPNGIEYTPSETYSLRFESYVAFYTRTERFFPPQPYDESVGFGFRVYARSRLLDFVRASVFSGDVTGEAPETFQHFGLDCTEQLVDVVSVQDPVLRFLGVTVDGAI